MRHHRDIETTVLNRFFLRIADIDCAIVSVDRALKVESYGATKKFLIHKAKPDVTIVARWNDLSEIKFAGQEIFDSGAVWQLYKENEDFLFSFSSPVFGPIPYKIALVRKDFTRVEILFHRPYFKSDEPVYPLEYPLDELLFINHLALGKGVEVHACGIVDSFGNGHLFVGQSGAGKSTIARLWQDEPGVTILSDDRIILRKIENKIWMYGTPWHGDAMLASPAKVQLTRIYFLARGEKNELVQQRKIDALSRLIACSFVPFYNPEGLDFTLAFFEEVVKTVPCYELRFLPGERVVEFIQGLSDE